MSHIVWHHHLINKPLFHLCLNGKVLLEHRNENTDLVEYYSPVIPKVFKVRM